MEWARIGGWSPVATVVFVRTDGPFGLSLIDINGDGSHYCLDKLERADGAWQVTSTDDDVALDGATSWTPRFVYGWGPGTAGDVVVVDYRGVRHSVVVQPDNWWTFIAPTDPAAGDGLPPTLA